MLLKLLHEIPGEGTLPIPFCDGSVTLILKLSKDLTQEKAVDLVP
jgi:hypothetical protein